MYIDTALAMDIMDDGYPCNLTGMLSTSLRHLPTSISSLLFAFDQHHRGWAFTYWGRNYTKIGMIYPKSLNIFWGYAPDLCAVSSQFDPPESRYWLKSFKKG